ncbi:hypothetical protein RIF29_05148 [Crotalaria pallida]|uniref:Uncharacterized protein n=1 Tax=Crotalaria pallida TaxID=3830 RepID=A0AAN9J1R5_CROPI
MIRNFYHVTQTLKTHYTAKYAERFRFHFRYRTKFFFYFLIFLFSSSSPIPSPGPTRWGCEEGQLSNQSIYQSTYLPSFSFTSQLHHLTTFPALSHTLIHTHTHTHVSLAKHGDIERERNQTNVHQQFFHRQKTTERNSVVSPI